MILFSAAIACINLIALTINFICKNGKTPYICNIFSALTGDNTTFQKSVSS